MNKELTKYYSAILKIILTFFSTWIVFVKMREIISKDAISQCPENTLQTVSFCSRYHHPVLDYPLLSILVIFVILYLIFSLFFYLINRYFLK